MPEQTETYKNRTIVFETDNNSVSLKIDDVIINVEIDQHEGGIVYFHRELPYYSFKSVLELAKAFIDKQEAG